MRSRGLRAVGSVVLSVIFGVLLGAVSHALLPPDEPVSGVQPSAAMSDGLLAPSSGPSVGAALR